MERLNLKPYLVRALQRAGIRTLGDIQSLSRYELAMLPGIGVKGLELLLSALQLDEKQMQLGREARIAEIEQQITDHTRAIEALMTEIETIKLD